MLFVQVTEEFEGMGILVGVVLKKTPKSGDFGERVLRGLVRLFRQLIECFFYTEVSTCHFYLILFHFEIQITIVIIPLYFHFLYLVKFY